ncbi:hypothetical protein GCM10020358_73510 [Amorphoplanes nipponensis]|uniref:Uncharacterized protein n=1 Tax=Actinoplanes nipponensis TaxID=135950 RepID=A0A919JIK6_9ACTN|nr:hypothetical protein Ani05nite_33010 [Actinoplanes nipponensis]
MISGAEPRIGWSVGTPGKSHDQLPERRTFARPPQTTATDNGTQRAGGKASDAFPPEPLRPTKVWASEDVSPNPRPSEQGPGPIPTETKAKAKVERSGITPTRTEP